MCVILFIYYYHVQRLLINYHLTLFTLKAFLIFFFNLTSTDVKEIPITHILKIKHELREF